MQANTIIVVPAHKRNDPSVTGHAVGHAAMDGIVHDLITCKHAYSRGVPYMLAMLEASCKSRLHHDRQKQLWFKDVLCIKCCRGASETP